MASAARYLFLFDFDIHCSAVSIYEAHPDLLMYGACFIHFPVIVNFSYFPFFYLYYFSF
jgi:hypothetical protein